MMYSTDKTTSFGWIRKTFEAPPDKENVVSIWNKLMIFANSPEGAAI